MSDPIRIRMYQAGFGDCFLLFLPTSAGTKTMLLDCGSLGGGGIPMRKVVKRLVDDVAAAGGANGATTHIDVIVATHRHKDHIGEFAQEIWKDVTTTEVWMPWTDSSDDPIALRLRAAQERFARALYDALPASAPAELRDLALNALANEKARAQLLKFTDAPGVTPRWLACADAGTNRFETEALPGIQIFVLGPLRDEATFANLDPPNEQNFAHRPGLAGAAAGPQGGTGAFPPRWCIAKGPLLHQEINEIRQSLPDSRLELLALADRLVNSTSLMLVLKVGGVHLLLPGDAQWSTWEAALLDDARRDLLTKTNFYKVGHHGSENATPIEFVEEILKDRDDCVSMASWVKRANWARIPEKHLVTGLKDVGPFADHETIPSGTTFTEDPDGYFIEATIPVP